MFRNIIIAAVCCGFLSQIIAQQKNGLCSAPPKGTNPSSCCQKPNNMDQRSFNQCIALHKDSPPRIGKGLKGPMNGLECVFDCAMNATGAVENGRPNLSKLLEKSRAALASTPEWIPIVNASIYFCLSQTMSNMPAIKNSLKGDLINGKDVCSPAAAYFYGCVFASEFSNCPARMFNNTGECRELKSYFEKCPTPQLN